MTIAQQIKWDFKANAFLVIKDTNGNLIYFEGSSGYWEKYEYDFQGNQIYYEALNGYWAKWEYDSKGNVIYYENSNGYINDNRPKPCENKIYTEKEVENLLMTQRENCYVSILSVTNDKKLAELAIKSPEPCNWRNQIQSEIL
jgi:hypothetical protein